MSVLTCLVCFFFSVPTFFVWKKLFKKFIKSDSRLLIVSSYATLLTTFIFIGLSWFLFYAATGYPKEKFDKAKWSKEDGKQFYMVEDLVRSKILIGKDSGSLKAILGKPDWRTYSTDSWHYMMGRSDGFFWPVDHNLHIYFNANKVDSVLYTSYHD